jgi:hypothetical protein
MSRKRKPQTARQPEAPVPNAQAWSPLPDASFRSLDWAGLSAYCRRHLPEPADEAGRRRFILAVRNGHAQKAAQHLREALQRWQKVMSFDLTSGAGPAKAVARDNLASARSWIHLLDDSLQG